MQERVRITRLTETAHFDAAVELQRTIWGYTDLDIDSRAMLVIARHFVGQVLGAFDGDLLIGLALAFHTSDPTRLHSHRVGVLPEYQNAGVGRSLNVAQRETALSAGFATIQWTFDALQSRNAHVNLVRLAGVARRYLPNLYGFSSSALHGSLPTDRLLFEWTLTSPRVESALRGTPHVPPKESRRIPLPPAGQRTSAEHQARMAREFESAFQDGYAATGFARSAEPPYHTLEVL